MRLRHRHVLPGSSTLLQIRSTCNFTTGALRQWAPWHQDTTPPAPGGFFTCMSTRKQQNKHSDTEFRVNSPSLKCFLMRLNQFQGWCQTWSLELLGSPACPTLTAQFRPSASQTFPCGPTEQRATISRKQQRWFKLCLEPDLEPNTHKHKNAHKHTKFSSVRFAQRSEPDAAAARPHQSVKSRKTQHFGTRSLREAFGPRGQRVLPCCWARKKCAASSSSQQQPPGSMSGNARFAEWFRQTVVRGRGSRSQLHAGPPAARCFV